MFLLGATSNLEKKNDMECVKIGEKKREDVKKDYSLSNGVEANH